MSALYEVLQLRKLLSIIFAAIGIARLWACLPVKTLLGTSQGMAEA